MRLPLPLRRVSATAAAVATLAALLSAAPSASGAGETSPGGSSSAPGRPFDRSSGPVSADERRTAARTLAEARGLGARPDASSEGREASIVLRDLALAQDALAPEDREVAERILARPTASGGDGYLDYAADADVTSDCVVNPVPSSNFCVHWARRTADAPPSADSDSDGVPDQVETTHQVLDTVWSRIVTQGTYSAPPADGTGPGAYRNRFDVYLGDIGADPQRLYGYCTPERVLSAYRSTSYCALDDDFSTSQFPGTSRGNLEVTAAHEFFHAVQFGIDYAEDGFFMENSSTWIEDEIFDDVNDNRNYFDDSALAWPGDPLDLAENWYGNWIWLRYLTEQFPEENGTGLPVLVKQAWDRTDDSAGSFSVRALAQAVTARGGSFPELVADFATANRSPATSYEEGAVYPSAPAARTVTVASPVTGSETIDHLAAATIEARPSGTLRPGTDLRVVVNAPSLPAELQVNVTRRLYGGQVVTRDLTLNRDGNGKIRVPFATGDTTAVDVTLVNAGRDYRCRVRGPFACQGFSRDENRRFDYALRLVAP
ncbi:hypothetical protein G7072_07120 [Nocardioides sp. HDW12B]|uniref:MXAN_6640 family putative metalloprotease n=1 Tax=Nocardioides sp. HDW12B TaxID=2714939 RepID=UPI00140B4078|nr:MXAN_6640 family putative metalloprotease [Nocardioides sp. HDW12B]QIK66142.1 hypothetical protein G7072_07120 [Nocardioides sp. HDW12B]